MYTGSSCRTNSKYSSSIKLWNSPTRAFSSRADELVVLFAFFLPCFALLPTRRADELSMLGVKGRK